MQSFATVDDLAAVLGEAVPPARSAGAELLLAGASRMIRTVTRQRIDLVVNDVVDDDTTGASKAILRELPVVKLSSVVLKSTAVPLVADTDFELLDSVGIIRRLPGSAVWPWLDVAPSPFSRVRWPPRVVLTITYSHGWKIPGVDYNPGNDPAIAAIVNAAQVIPEDLKLLVVASSARAYVNPSGLLEEGILSRQVRYRTNTSEASSLFFTAAELEVLAGYDPGKLP